ncbi:MAG: peptidylprolyl isomerase [Bacteroidales bacterium]|jgi:peptidyl-prolyl cis-trans isomerase SurA|nr:peptidylprolyl isomerase [Bacteroidales bacterium]
MKTMIKAILFGLIFGFVMQVWAQTDDPVVMKLGKEEIKLSNFKNTYQKNNDLKKTTEQELRDYIDLYINFRLKYAEAEELHLDTIVALQEELASYRKQAAEKYLTDKEVNDKIVEEALERMKWDIRASHILKNVLSDAMPADTLAAYNAIMKIRSRILKGESFAEVAAKESDDLSARDKMSAGGEVIKKGNGGDLGYFTAFDLIYAFETGAYNTPVGQISMPVRSEFGYHLIFVQDKKPALGKIKATQILLPYNNSPNLTASEKEQDATAVKEKITNLYTDIQKGDSFEDALKKQNIAEKPGQLPLFGCNRFEGDFILGLYGLKKGDVSKPINTSFGWHIVKIDEVEPVVIDDETRSSVKNKILRDSRSNKSKEAFIERVKSENKFKELVDKKMKTTPLEDFYTVVDSSIYSGDWNLSQADHLSRNMFSFADKNYTQYDFAKYLYKHQFQGIQNIDVKVLINYAYREFIENTVEEYEDNRLEEKYPEFADLMKEYKEGILLYELSEIKVWRKAEIDTVGLENYYQTVKENHLYPVRLKAEFYRSTDAATTKKVVAMLVKEVSGNKIMAKMNKKSITLIMDTVTYWEGQNQQFDNIVDWTKINGKGIYFVFVNTQENELVRSLEILPPSPKPLNEIKGVIVSDYQNLLEKEWIESVHKNNSIWVDYDKILSLIK